MSTNRDLLKAFRSPVARFYPCDFHVHSLGSADVCIGDRFSALPQDLQSRVTKLSRIPDDPGRYDREMIATVPPNVFYGALLARRDEVTTQSSQSESDNWAFLAITDHNTAYYATALSRHAWEQRAQDRLVILPGMELEVRFPFGASSTTRCPIHLLCIFPPCTGDSDILLAINNARASTSPPWIFGAPLDVEDLPGFVQRLRSNSDCPALCVAAHVSSSKGIESEPKMVVLDPLRAEIARIEGALERARADSADADEQDLLKQMDALQKQCDPAELHLEVLRLIGCCGFDAIQISDQSDEVHFRRLHRFLKNSGRATPIVCSDSHSPEEAFACSSGIPYLKISQTASSLSPSEMFSEIRDRAILFGETRTTYSTPGRVTHWIEGIEIAPDAPDARRFWNFPSPAMAASESPPSIAFRLSLSPNLNCLVGGRGSGKSAAVEAIAFITQPEEFADTGKKPERDRPEWYGRAVATLRGCQVRLVFKTNAKEGIGALPKRALIASRYFDPANNHGGVELRDADSQTVVDAAAKPPRVSIFRVHEIEQAAQPENLRRLFDNLCGVEVAQLTTQIEDIRSRILEQRETVLETCRGLADLTADGSPLRQYGIRKQQFAAVNRPEIQEKYATVDKSQAVSTRVTKTVESWDEIDSVEALTTLDDGIGSFFTQTRDAVTNEDGQPKDGYTVLHQLVSIPSPGQQNENELAIRTSLVQAKTALSSFAEKLVAVQTGADAVLEAARNELAQAGLPAGSRDRETKKLAFDEAEKSLVEYRRLLALLEELLKQRQELFDSLVSLCEHRTKLRKETADELTRQLAQDLDTAILKVEVDARPMADRTKLETWLGENVGPAFSKFRPQRLKALLESGILPRDLIRVFLHDPEAQQTLLRIDKTRADEGRIDDNDVVTIINNCQGKSRVAIDGYDEFLPEFRDSLPADFREGVWAFPVRSGKTPTLKINAVLQLDEIVLDDLPEIRLNDRPSDPASACRPLSELSPGQRCSAILPVLLLSGDTPLIIDQPEENLDNRLIRQVIVNILASMKLRRQVIVATHNPNLPVLGDAEQCVVLQASGRDEATVIATGVLDSPQVASFITDIMEGGREAFQYRQSVYQAHWNSVIDEQP